MCTMNPCMYIYLLPNCPMHYQISHFIWSATRGRFAVVKRCDQRGSKRTVAVKLVNKKLMKRDQVTQELSVLQRLQHPHIVCLLDTYETSSSYALVLEM